ncbi:MAG: beta-lactamase family protein [Chitinophagaceae bacterium]|nr:beta-lactamase family protein [Chitinophagaceae bacterium]
MRMIKTLTAILLFSLPFGISAQLNTAKMDSLFDQLNQHQKAMVSVCVMDKGQVSYQRSIGMAEVEHHTPAIPQTLYRIGSISKMFTAVMIMQLVEEKKLKLETPLSTFFPGLPNSQKITIQHLLSHHSGLHNFTSDSDYLSYHQQAISEADMIKRFEKMTPDFKPGEKGEYSNTNYVLLTYIIEKISKDTYANQLQERICKKISLQNTSVFTAPKHDHRIAKSYSFENGQWKREADTDESVPRGAGNIQSTATDLCLFITALFQGKLVSKASLQSMKTLKDGYGLGMFKFPFNEETAYGHTGGIDGFESMLGYFEKDSTCFSIVGNGFNYPMNDIAIGILNIRYNEPYSIPTFQKKMPGTNLSRGPEGVYGNSKVSMKITIRDTGSGLTAQGTDQAAFPLEKVGELDYKFDAAGIKITFVRDATDAISSFHLFQGGMDLLFEKE